MLTLKADKREISGKKNKDLREKGLIPAVVYGGDEKSQSIMVDLKDFQKTWQEAGESSLVELEIGGDKKNILIKEVQTDSVSDVPIHADFYAVRMDRPIQAAVSIEFVGESPAVKAKGAILVRVMHELEVEALPKDLPHELEVDISGLKNFDDRFLVKNLKLLPGVKVLAGPDDIIVLAEEPKEEEKEATTPGMEDIEVVGEKGKKEDQTAEQPAESGGSKGGQPDEQPQNETKKPSE